MNVSIAPTLRFSVLNMGFGAIFFVALGLVETRAQENSSFLQLSFKTETDESELIIPELNYSGGASLRRGTLKFGVNGVVELDAGGRRVLDADAGATLNAELDPMNDTHVSLDFEYQFERDYDAEFSSSFAAIDVNHRFSADLTVSQNLANVRLDVSSGVVLKLHDDLDRIGFPAFDRRAQDYTDFDAALRVAFNRLSDLRPFIEVAYVSRDYLESRDVLGRDRDMGGPEIIAGVEYETDQFDAQVAAIYAMRKHAQSGMKDAVVFGPYADFTWRPRAGLTLQGGIAAGLAQDSNGPLDVYALYGGKLEVSYTVSDRLLVSASSEMKFEDYDGGESDLLTISPTVGAEWRIAGGASAVASFGGSMEHSKEEDVPSVFASAGFRYALN